MAHRNPWRARLAQHKARWPVPIQELQAQAFAVLQIAYEGVSADDDDQRRRNILCFFQGLTSLAKVLESSEIAMLEARIEALEARLSESTNGYHSTRP